MSPRSNTESYPAFARIGLREKPGKTLNQVTCPDRDSNPGHLVSQPDALTVTPQVMSRNNAHLPSETRGFSLSQAPELKSHAFVAYKTLKQDTIPEDVWESAEVQYEVQNQSDSLMAADGDCHHLCKLMAPVRHRWSINDVIGGIRNTVMSSDCSLLWIIGKREYGKWEPRALLKALDELRSGVVGLNVAISTKFQNRLQATFDGQVANHPANRSVNERNTAFPRKIEEELVQHILMFEEYLFELTITDVSDVRFELTTSVPQESRSRGLHGALMDGAAERGERAYAAREWRESARASGAGREERALDFSGVPSLETPRLVCRSSTRVCVRICVSIRRPEFECSGPQLEGPEFECSGPQLEGPEFEYSGLSLKNPSYEVYEEVGCVSSDGSTKRTDIIIIDRQKDKGVILDPTIRFEMHEQQPEEGGMRGTRK
ncbi:hypothetical protein ANN_16338 [Periplaneta americana]|uniref:Uncharacterized protein n=1 Tax=Periplaneta americana TaxID=6978 RepID=A0ABQ8SIP8_PERAM|nr:hypothetical protein ANN_16338 [Periplaneta americana]